MSDPAVSWETAAALHQWLRAPLDVLLARLDQLDRDMERAMKLQDGDRIKDLGIWEELDPDVPPAVCSILPLDCAT